MDPVAYLFLHPHASVLFCAAATLAVGLGYRKLGRLLALGVTVMIAIGAGAALLFWMLILLFGIATPYGPVAALWGGLWIAILTGVAAVLWITVRCRPLFVRGKLSWPGLLGTAALCVFAWLPSVLSNPVRHSTQELARALVTAYNTPGAAKAKQELLQRGPAAASEVIAQLHGPAQPAVPMSNEKRKALLALLGKLGGQEAVQELRAWLNSEREPDLSEAAALALGEAGDHESATAIGDLLELRTYEWRSCHLGLIQALHMLKAAEEVPHIRSALRLQPGGNWSMLDEMLLSRGIRTLVDIGTPEAWQAIQDIANDGVSQRDTVSQILKEMGKSLPATGDRSVTPQPEDTRQGAN